MSSVVTIPGISKKKLDPGKTSSGRSKKPSKDDGVSKPVVIYLELPEHLAALKSVMERLGRLHNRKLTGECLQALQEYAQRHGAWPASDQQEGGSE